MTAGITIGAHRAPLQKIFLIAERNFDVARGLHHFAIGRHQPQPIDRIGDRDMPHLIVLITDHRSEMSFICQLHRLDPEARTKNSIESGGRTAPLQMSEYAAAGLFASTFSNLLRNDLADAAETKFSAFHLTLDLLTVFWLRPFVHDDERAKITPGIPFLYRCRDLVVVKRDFRNQNNIGATGNAAVQCDPAGVTSHHFYDHDTFVTCGRGVQPVERVHHNVDRGIKSECHRSRFEIVIDRLGNADAIDARFLQLKRGDHRAVAADNDQRLNSKFVQYLASLCDHFSGNDRTVTGADLSDKMPTIGCADDGSSQRHDSVGTFPIQDDVIPWWKKSLKTVAKANHFPAKLFSRENYAAQDGIKPGTVATTGQNTDPWFHFMAKRLKQFFWIGQAASGGPLVVELPAAFDQPSAFAKSIWTAEEHDKQMTRINRCHRALSHNFRFAICGENQTVSGASGPAGFYSIDALLSKKLVGVSQKITQFACAALKRDLPLFLRNIKTESGFIHGIAGKSRHVLRCGVRQWPYIVIDAVWIYETGSFHLQLRGQRIHLADKGADRRDFRP